MTGKLQRPAMAEVIPEGRMGEAAVEHYTVDNRAARVFNVRLMIRMGSWRRDELQARARR